MISIVVATFNASKQLPGFFKSLLMLDKNQYRLIIIDGASTDDTVSVIEAHSKIVDYYISEKDHGIYDAWNKGLKKVETDWVLFLGADDRIVSKNEFENCVFRLKSIDSDCLVAFTEVAVVDPNTNKVLFELGCRNESFYQNRFLSELLFPHTGTFHRVHNVKQVGGFDSSYKVAGDYDLLLRMVKRDVHKIKKITCSFASMAFGGVSTNRITRHLAYDESIKARKMNNIKDISFILYYRFIKAKLISILLKYI